MKVLASKNVMANIRPWYYGYLALNVVPQWSFKKPLYVSCRSLSVYRTGRDPAQVHTKLGNATPDLMTAIPRKALAQIDALKGFDETI